MHKVLTRACRSAMRRARKAALCCKCMAARAMGKKCVVVEVTIPLHWNYLEGLARLLVHDNRFMVIVLSNDADGRRLQGSHFTNDYSIVHDLPFHHLITSSSYRDKRSIYVMHSLASAHVIYPDKTFDGFGYIFCAGPHHIRELNSLLGDRCSTDCLLVPTGYEYLDRLIDEAQSSVASEHGGLPCVLIAPSHGPTNCLARHGVEMVGQLIDGHRVRLRPHVVNIKQDKEVLDEIDRRFGTHPNFTYDDSSDSRTSMMTADVLISDWSGVAFEYALSRLRPVLFVDGQMKVFNERWQSYLPTPGIEATYRKRIGAVISDMSSLRDEVTDLLGSREIWREKIADARSELVFHVGSAALAGYEAMCDIAEGRVNESWMRPSAAETK